MSPDEKLLFILRERLHLTGTKNGCSQGHCRACTVAMKEKEGWKAVRSCLIKTNKLDEAEILTIEGISPNKPGDDLHPIQKAFIDKTAVQCGFCTPGMIMELFVLFENNPSASEKEIIDALEGHLCRCTGYKPVLDAALQAQKYTELEKSS